MKIDEYWVNIFFELFKSKLNVDQQEEVMMELYSTVGIPLGEETHKIINQLKKDKYSEIRSVRYALPEIPDDIRLYLYYVFVNALKNI